MTEYAHNRKEKMCLQTACEFTAWLILNLKVGTSQMPDSQWVDE